jgi:hypothetical protein
MLTDVVSYLNDNNKPSVPIEGTVNVNNPTFSITTAGARAMANSLSDAYSTLGLAGTIAALTAGTAKVVSTIPPFQKVGILIGSAFAGGAIHSRFVTLNRTLNNKSYNTYDSNNSSRGGGGIVGNYNFLDSSNMNTNSHSPLIDILNSIENLNAVSLSLLIIFCMNLIFIYYIKDDFKLNLSYFLGDSLNNKFNFYIHKLVYLNRKASVYYMVAAIFVVFISIIFSIYFLSVLLANLDVFVEKHSNFKEFYWFIIKFYNIYLFKVYILLPTYFIY